MTPDEYAAIGRRVAEDVLVDQMLGHRLTTVASAEATGTRCGSCATMDRAALLESLGGKE